MLKIVASFIRSCAMDRKTLGTMIAELRKAKGLTQLELAEKMNVTDKAVSKWERDLSCPDISSIPRLAEILGVSVDELMQSRTTGPDKKENIQDTIMLVLKCVGLAMGVAVAALSIIGELETEAGLTMLGIGLACIAMQFFRR